MEETFINEPNAEASVESLGQPTDNEQTYQRYSIEKFEELLNRV